MLVTRTALLVAPVSELGGHGPYGTVLAYGGNLDYRCCLVGHLLLNRNTGHIVLTIVKPGEPGIQGLPWDTDKANILGGILLEPMVVLVCSLWKMLYFMLVGTWIKILKLMTVITMARKISLIIQF